MTIENDKFDDKIDDVMDEDKLVNPMEMLTPEQALEGFEQSLAMLVQVAPMLGVSNDDLISALAGYLYNVMTAEMDTYHGVLVQVGHNGKQLCVKLLASGVEA